MRPRSSASRTPRKTLGIANWKKTGSVPSDISRVALLQNGTGKETTAAAGLLRYVNIGRIGILAGGGDVPGLNAVIKIVTYRGSENAIEVIGLRRGWEALKHLNVEDSAGRSRP
jgi:hypothetical protein